MTVDLASYIRDIADFPTQGIVFKDITPLLASPVAFRAAVDAIAATLDGSGATKVAGVEARGFVFAAPVAAALGVGFVPVRKVGKLPWNTVQESYDLEYGQATIEVHRDAAAAGERVALVDDVLATGGTAAAAVALFHALGAEIVACSFLIELGFLSGRSRLPDLNVHRVISF